MSSAAERGSLVVILLLVHYSAPTLLFGALLARVDALEPLLARLAPAQKR
jgi:hypothetical protein